LKMADGGRFNANLGGSDSLTSAPVSSFGFLNSAPAAVSITGSTLEVAPQKSFSVIAGNITMDSDSTTATLPTIGGQGSRVNLLSVQSPGEAQLDVTSLDTSIDIAQFATLGQIVLTVPNIDTSG